MEIVFTIVRVMRILPGKIPPAVKIVRHGTPAPVSDETRLSVALIEESECAAGTAGIHRLPEAVEH